MTNRAVSAFDACLPGADKTPADPRHRRQVWTEVSSHRQCFLHARILVERLVQGCDDRIAHLNRADQRAFLAGDVGRAQTLGEHCLDR